MTLMEKIIISILTIAIILLIGGATFLLIDSSYGETKTGYGNIVNKYYEPAYTTTTYTTINKVTIPQIIYHPETWNIEIALDFGNDIISVPKDDYYKLKINELVKVHYKKGFFSKKVYIKRIL